VNYVEFKMHGVTRKKKPALPLFIYVTLVPDVCSFAFQQNKKYPTPYP